MIGAEYLFLLYGCIIFAVAIVLFIYAYVISYKRMMNLMDAHAVTISFAITKALEISFDRAITKISDKVEEYSKRPIKLVVKNQKVGEKKTKAKPAKEDKKLSN